MILEPDIFEYIEGDHVVFERDSLGKLARERRLAAFRHTGYWQCMDTQRDKTLLERVWEEGNAPWKTWE